MIDSFGSAAASRSAAGVLARPQRVGPWKVLLQSRSPPTWAIRDRLPLQPPSEPADRCPGIEVKRMHGRHREPHWRRRSAGTAAITATCGAGAGAPKITWVAATAAIAPTAMPLRKSSPRTSRSHGPRPRERDDGRSWAGVAPWDRAASAFPRRARASTRRASKCANRTGRQPTECPAGVRANHSRATTRHFSPRCKLSQDQPIGYSGGNGLRHQFGNVRHWPEHSVRECGADYSARRAEAPGCLADYPLNWNQMRVDLKQAEPRRPRYANRWPTIRDGSSGRPRSHESSSCRQGPSANLSAQFCFPSA